MPCVPNELSFDNFEKYSSTSYSSFSITFVKKNVYEFYPKLWIVSSFIDNSVLMIVYF